MLKFDSEKDLHIDCFLLNVRSAEINLDENDIIYFDIVKCHLYETKNVGAYFNTIFINDTVYSEVDGENAEIRLSLVCRQQSNIRHIFINGKKKLH